MRRRRDRSGRPLDEVLVDAERLVELSERLFEAVGDRLALGVVEALVVDALQPIDEPERAGLRQERRVVDESPEREQAVDAAGVRVVPQNAADRSPWRTASTRVGAAGLRRVVAGPRLAGAQQNLEHLRIARGAPPRERVEHREEQAAGERSCRTD